MKLLKERIKVLENQLDAADAENDRLRAELDKIKNDYANLESASAPDVRGGDIAAHPLDPLTHKQNRDMLALYIEVAGRFKDVASEIGSYLKILEVNINHKKRVAKFWVFFDFEVFHFELREHDAQVLLNASDIVIEAFLISALQ